MLKARERSRQLSPNTETCDVATSKGLQPLDTMLWMLVDVTNLIFSSRASAGNAQAPGFSSDMARLMDSGVVWMLTDNSPGTEVNYHHLYDGPKSFCW